MLGELALLALALPASTAQDASYLRCTLDVDPDPNRLIELPFHVAVEGTRAFVLNGAERIEIPEVAIEQDTLRLGFPHFDSEITAQRTATGAWVGTWTKQRRRDDVAEVPFHADPVDGTLERFARFDDGQRAAWGVARIEGRWRVDFESGDTPAVAFFDQFSRKGSGATASPAVTGTFLTDTGDYRFLEGAFDMFEGAVPGQLRLSCFDGAHAFLFDALIDSNGKLAGTFRSGDWWIEAWTAVPDDEIALPDPYRALERVATTRVSETWALRTDGTEVTLAELWTSMDTPPRAMLVQVLGTWCPNCYDETELLKELHAKYADAGLAVVGLCFELTGDVQRDLAQIERYRTTRKVPYPLLWAGEADKRDTAEALGLTDRILSYPTTLFLDGLGNVDAIHSGFVGPAAAEEHAELRAEFEERVQRLLATDRDATSRELWTGAWSDHRSLALQAWPDDPELMYVLSQNADPHLNNVVPRDQGMLRRAGDSLLLDNGDAVVIDPSSRIVRLLDSMTTPLLTPTSLLPVPMNIEEQAETWDVERSPSERLALLRQLWMVPDRETKAGLPPFPAETHVGRFDLRGALADPDPAVRRLALLTIPLRAGTVGPNQIAPSLDSSDPRMRRNAAHALRSFEWLPDEIAARLDELGANDPFPSVRAAAQGAEPNSTKK